jgi:quercetin dioxygenase-like cupin family protein
MCIAVSDRLGHSVGYIPEQRTLMRTKSLALGAGLALTMCFLAGGAAAAPGSGTTVTNDFTGVLDGPAVAKQDGIKLRTREDVKVRSFTLTYAVGAFSGWHSHPGIVIAVVQSGSVVRQIGCKTETFTAGQAFTEVKPHYVSNLYTKAGPDAVPAVLSITQIYPADFPPPPRTEQNPPKCHPRS